MNRFSLFIMIMAVLLLAFTFCSDYKSNMVGSELFDRDNRGAQLFNHFYALTTDTVFFASSTPGEAIRLYLGESQNLKSTVIMQFVSFPDTIVGEIDSVVVSMYRDTTYGSQDEIMPISLRHVQSTWNEIEVKNTDQPLLLGDEFGTALISTGLDTISFQLDPTVVRQWIDADSTQEYYGFAMEPVNAQSIISYRSLNSSSLGARMLIHTHNDTSTFNYVAAPQRDASLAIYNNALPQNHLLISNGAAIRSLLEFDVSSIPSDATINRAMLTLRCDTTLSYPSHADTFSLKAFAVASKPWLPPDINLEDSSSTYYSYMSGDSLRLNLTYLVQHQTALFRENNGFLLMGYGESSAITRRFFYDATHDTTLAPRLDVFYSLPPSSRQ